MDNSEKETTIKVDNELAKNLKIHTNLNQVVLTFTEDKIRIVLMNYLSKVGKKSAWVAPFGILLTIMITILTTTFKKFIFSPDTWNAVFVIVAVLSIIWLFRCISDAFVSIKIDDVIEELKRSSPPDENVIIQEPRMESKFKIIKGTYGIPSQKVDVTDTLQKLVKDDRLETHATNGLAGSDPVPGTPKFLNVEYEQNGSKFIKEYKENDPVNIP